MEQVFADLTDGPLAHMPSGSFAANAAWTACAAIAHNLLRAAGSLASLTYAKARGATLRRDLIHVAARTARSGRGHLTLHLPEDWHRAALAYLAGLAVTGQVTHAIGQVLQLADAATAWASSRGGHVRVKLILSMDTTGL